MIRTKKHLMEKLKKIVKTGETEENRTFAAALGYLIFASDTIADSKEPENRPMNSKHREKTALEIILGF